MKTIIVIAVLLCAVAAIPIPEEPQEVELVNVPLKGDKELDIITLSNGDGSISARNKRTIGVLRELFPTLSQVVLNDEENLLEHVDAGSDTEESARVARETNNDNENNINNDQDTQSSDKVEDQQANESSGALDELTLDEENDENRNKRFLSFGLNGGQGNSGGSGGSGNFLFDIIRLVSGSSGTEQTDERENSPDEAKNNANGDGYTEGIPGPVTRLFVLANRGLSNLIQDLILRIAQTSERVVNFKARLITALI
jgi:hypothetical protein